MEISLHLSTNRHLEPIATDHDATDHDATDHDATELLALHEERASVLERTDGFRVDEAVARS